MMRGLEKLGLVAQNWLERDLSALLLRMLTVGRRQQTIEEPPFKCHEEVLYLQPMIPPKRFDIFPPDWGMLRRSRRVQIFL